VEALDAAGARVALAARDRRRLDEVAAGWPTTPSCGKPTWPAPPPPATWPPAQWPPMELGPAGVRVNCVAPGTVVTDLWAANRAVPGVIAGVEAQTALRRWATPEDIAGVVVFLVSDAARFVTGETICADGGMARTLDLYGGPV
jgi:hypothetical protein